MCAFESAPLLMPEEAQHYVCAFERDREGAVAHEA